MKLSRRSSVLVSKFTSRRNAFSALFVCGSLAALGFTGCASKPALRPDAPAAVAPNLPGAATGPSSADAATAATPDSPGSDVGLLPPKVLTEEIKAADAKIEAAQPTDIPISINDHVNGWIDYFAVKDHDRFQNFLHRGIYYRDLVEGLLEKQGVPKELYYLAMIESGYSTQATSRARAVGAWQFIRATGRRYGLKSNFYLDERRDIIRATTAAARYLKDLHDEFGSWYLAMAAYNAGEGRIRSAIRRGGTQDFWELARRRALPRETMDYVPKYLAAFIIGRDLKKYGFDSAEPGKSERFPKVERVEVPSSVHLKEVARAADVSLKDLKRMNPQLIRNITPKQGHPYAIYVPEEKVELVQEVSDDLPRARGLGDGPTQSFGVRAASANRRLAGRTAPTGGLIRIAAIHRVRTGDTLASIARHYQVSVRQIKRLNRLHSNRLNRGQTLKIRIAKV